MRLYAAANKSDDFTGYKEAIHTKLHQLKAKVDQKLASEGKPRDTDAIKLDMEIKGLIQEVERLLNSLNDALRKQAKDKSVLSISP